MMRLRDLLDHQCLIHTQHFRAQDSLDHAKT